MSVSNSGGSELAGDYPAHLPGLPRGRHGLPPAQVAASHRSRLQRAAISAIAHKGYAETTVADIVTGARVSRREFYQHFDDKLSCFLAAAAEGGKVLFTKLSETSTHTGARTGLTLARAYLDTCVSEPEFTRCLTVELPGAGAQGLAQRAQADKDLAVLVRRYHAQIAPQAQLPDERMYLAAVGAIAELVVSYVAAGKIAQLGELDLLCAEILRRLLGIP